jgi:hypothetical protein
LSNITHTTSILTSADRWDHVLARVGVNRAGHRVRPGLYALGMPDAASPVFVTANYTLSFDALRAALAGVSGYILVLDTRGINVWCAAGKGTFGTNELVQRIEATGLKDVVTHRRLILPQLGAPGVAAHEVKQRSGFKVEYGPVRAADLPAYLRAGAATPEMRRVRFDLLDRLVLIPVDITQTFIPMAIAALVMYLIAGWWGALAAVAAVQGGVTLFPILLPFLPTREFSTKGFILGAALAAPFVVAALWGAAGDWPAHLLRALAALTGISSVVAYIGLNFTGATTFTSKSGVQQEMRRYIRPMAGLAGVALLCLIALAVLRIIAWLG